VPTPSEQDGLSLPGYSLVARLGAGGYGEVWLAHAPGGLTKAVKFIYGSYNEKRAEHELRALQRIKDLRHPFLLSLERIEVVDSRLVIVTELADNSLKDRFDECRQQGSPGVPREELIKYLRDAADALDFLSQKHSLQHLDVKPENLLLVAGHVKVADFGLVKDVGNSQASLVGGLTPLYSAPEVFQGSPSPYSDQYSLAVLYQEMLTGVLPFPGVTAAELTLQHLHDEPDMAALPTSDRYVLARALAKEPSQRFASCSDMIQALFAGGTGPADSWSESEQLAAAPDSADQGGNSSGFGPTPRRLTECFGEPLEAPPAEVSTSMLIDVEPRTDAVPTSLAPIELPASTPGAGQPTLVVGVGGVAAAVLRGLRLRLSKQFGDDAPPAVQLLLLDSDPKNIATAMQGDPRTALKPEETLALPLRRPQEYRDQSARLMKWLSRRWLYNIPRSLRTEGMRPLGRLAFADHARQAIQRIRMSLSQAAAAESAVLSHERTGLEFNGKPPRVYILAAISGGAGSGMSLDVACAVRTVLEKMNLADAQTIGLFLHATGRDARHCDLAKVNAYSWLTEFNHFQRPGGAFPGDESCGLPPLARPPLDAAYLVDFDAEEADGGLDHAARAIAEYVYLDALTPAQAFFDQCRREAVPPSPAAALRTFSLQKTPAATEDAIDKAAAALSREVVLRWAGSANDPSHPPTTVRDTNQIVQGAATLISQMQLKLDGLASNARSLVEAQFGGDQQAFVDSLLASVNTGGKPMPAADLLASIDRLFAPPTDAEAGAFVLERPVEAIVSPLTMKLAGDLARWVLARLDDRQERLAGAQRAVAWLLDHLTLVEQDAARMAAGLARQVADVSDDARRDPRFNSPADAPRRVLAYFRMRVDQHAVAASVAIARRLLTELKTLGQTIAEFGRHLKHLAGSLPRPAEPEPADAPAAANPSPPDPLSAALATHGAAVADSIDAQIQDEFIAATGGLFQTIMGNSRVRAQMLVILNKFARRAAEQLAARPDVMNAAFAAMAGNATPAADTDAADLPTFLRSGGVFRMLSVVPAQCPDSQTAKLGRGPMASDATVLVAPGQDVVTVCEGWGLPLATVAIDLINNRRDYADFAARVQTRSDVPWLPLASPAARQPVVDPFADFVASPPTVTQVI
jgi:serine/threonine protein kinase